MTSFQDAMPNGGIQERAHGAEKNIDLNQKRTTDGFKRDYRGMAAGPKLCADHHPMMASIDGFRGLEERQRQAIAGATSVDSARAFSLVDLASVSRVAGDRHVGSAPLQD